MILTIMMKTFLAYLTTVNLIITYLQTSNAINKAMKTTNNSSSRNPSKVSIYQPRKINLLQKRNSRV